MMLEWIYNYILKKRGYSGVEVQKHSSPEFIVTTHAYERILSRVRCRKDKIKKVVVKAWFSEEKVSKKFIVHKETRGFVARKGEEICYRIFSGFVFVFILRQRPSVPLKILVTVYKNVKKGHSIPRNEKLKKQIEKSKRKSEYYLSKVRISKK